MWPKRGVPIEPVGIQVPAGPGTPDGSVLLMVQRGRRARGRRRRRCWATTPTTGQDRRTIDGAAGRRSRQKRPTDDQQGCGRSSVSRGPATVGRDASTSAGGARHAAQCWRWLHGDRCWLERTDAQVGVDTKGVPSCRSNWSKSFIAKFSPQTK